MNFYAHRSFDSQKFPNFQRIIFFDRTEAIFDSDTPMDREKSLGHIVKNIMEKCYTSFE